MSVLARLPLWKVEADVVQQRRLRRCLIGCHAQSRLHGHNPEAENNTWLLVLPQLPEKVMFYRFLQIFGILKIFGL